MKRIAQQSAFEQSQVRLRIIPKDSVYTTPNGDEVTGKKVHETLTKNKVWQEDDRGKYIPILFDGHAVRFREGEVITLGKIVADCMRHYATIIVGNGLTGPQVPYLEVVEEFVMGDGSEKIVSPTACGYCHEECGTLPRLTRHYMKKHPEKMKTDEEEFEAGEKASV